MFQTGIQIKTSSSAAAAKEKPVLESSLTTEQLSVAAQVLQGDSVFLTGPAGSGKSYLFRFIIQELKKKYIDAGDQALAITAPTGIAAINVNGQTIHSWAGVGLGKGNADKLIAKVQKSDKVFNRWANCKTLLIDEVSMLPSDLFQKLSIIGAHVRDTPRPFGGIQIVCCGDFYQLPPVGLGKWAEFCFRAPAWTDLNMKTCTLTQVIRQSGDQSFVNILNELRVGVVSKECSALFHSCHVHQKPFPTDGIIPTKLFCTNRDVDKENEHRLSQLTTKAVLFPGMDELELPTVDFRTPSQKEIQALKDAADAKVPGNLTLKVGAQVVLLRNLRVDLVNGSRGVVLGFQDISVDYNGRRGSRGSSHSSHKRHKGSGNPGGGMGLDENNIANNVSTTGGSSSSSSSSSSASTSSSSSASASNTLHEVLWSGTPAEPGGRLLQVVSRSDEPVYAPIIQFSNGRIAVVPPFEFFIGLGTKGSVVRLQLPIKLAWALTVHKSQGMTLSRVLVSAADAFEVGQVYVAISRCVSTEGLWISGGRITDRAVKAHPEVLAFMDEGKKEEEEEEEEEEENSDFDEFGFDDDDDGSLMAMMDQGGY